MRGATFTSWTYLRAVLCCCLGGAWAGTIQAAVSISIEAQESIGIRRFQYPVAVELEFSEAVARDVPFRLLSVIVRVRAADRSDSSR